MVRGSRQFRKGVTLGFPVAILRLVSTAGSFRFCFRLLPHRDKPHEAAIRQHIHAAVE